MGDRSARRRRQKPGQRFARVNREARSWRSEGPRVDSSRGSDMRVRVRRRGVGFVEEGMVESRELLRCDGRGGENKLEPGRRTPKWRVLRSAGG